MRFYRIFLLVLPLALSSCRGVKETTSSEGGSSNTTSSSSSSSDTSSSDKNHNFSSTWSYDEHDHWHACIDEGYEHLRKDQAAHTLFIQQEIEPTFEKEGKIIQACRVCEYTRETVVPKKEHNYSSTYTYYDEDNHYQQCTDPGYYDLKKIEPHEFTVEVVKPTYEHGGYTEHTCNKCHYSYQDNETPQLDHHYGEWTYDENGHYAQCIDPGYEHLSISGPHTMVEEVIEPTFELQGYTRHYCSVGCGYEYNDNYTDPKEHSYSAEWSHDEEHHWHACTDEGYETLKSDYGEHAINYSKQYYDPLPSYEHPGYHIFPCTCGYVMERVLVDQYIDGIALTINEEGTGCYVSGTKSYGLYSEMTIPETYNDLPVVGIGPNAFINNTVLTKLNLPDTITYIGDSAFMNSSIKEITLPDSVTSIGDNAFKNTALTIQLNEGLLSIGDHAFENVTFGDEITFPTSLQAIGDSAFEHCNLTEFNLNEGLLTIGEKAFANTKITSISLPDSVIETGFAVFSGCNLLTKVSLPYAGKTRDIEPGNYSIGNAFGHYFGSDSYSNSFMLNQKYGLNSDQKADFYYPNSLTDVVIRGGGRIPNYFFFGMTHIRNVYIGKSITHFDFFAFRDNPDITNIYYGGDITDWANIESGKGTPLINRDNNLRFYTEDSEGTIEFDGKKFTYPTEVNVNFCNAIPEMFLYGLSQITKVTIADGVETIGEFAFAFLTNLTYLSIPDTVTSISYNALTGCSNISYLRVSKNGGYVSLVGMKKLETLIIAQAMTGAYRILGDSFQNSDGVAIQQYPYDNDTVYYRGVPSSLKYVTVLGGDVGTGYFSGCTMIQKVNFGDDMGEYGVSLFRNTNLQELTFEKYPYNEQSASSTQYDQYSLGKLVSKRASNNSTKTVQLYQDRGLPPESQYYRYTSQEIEASTCYWPNTLTKLTIKEGYLGQYALANLTVIQELTLGAGVRLGNNCCMLMDSLRVLNLEAGISIDDIGTPFRDTTGIETINFKGTPEEFEEIRLELYIVGGNYTVNYIE